MPIFLRMSNICVEVLCFQQIMTNKIHSARFVQLFEGSLLTMRISISDYQIHLIGWILFLISAIGFCMRNHWELLGNVWQHVLPCCMPGLYGAILSYSKEVFE